MKKLKFAASVSIFALLSFYSLSAQIAKPKTVKEYGIGLSNFNSFSLQYRWGNEMKLKTISANIGGSSGFGKSNGKSVQTTPISIINTNGTSKSQPPVSINVGIYLNSLKFKVINEKFGLNFGTSIGVSYNYNESNNSGYSSDASFIQTSKSSNLGETIQPSIGYLLGAYYKFSPEFLIYAGIVPSFYYSYSRTKTTEQRETLTIQSGDSQSYSNKNTNYQNGFGFGFGNSGAVLTFVYRITKKD